MTESETIPTTPAPAQVLELLADWKDTYSLNGQDFEKRAKYGVALFDLDAATLRAQAAALASREAECERLQGRVIAEQSREIARIEAEIAVLADEFGKIAQETHWARLQSLAKLIDALYDQKNAIKRVADWRAVADQDRRQALTPTPETPQ